MENFVHKYALSKTLRFELKPVGETAEKIKDFKNQAIAAVVEQDKKRAEDYKKIKKIIDDYHRYFIEQVLGQEILTDDDIQKAFETYIAFKGAKDDGEKKQYQSVQKTLRAKIAKIFKEQFDNYCLFDAGLLNEKGSGENRKKGVLWEWLKYRFDNKQINQSEFEEAEKLIKSFNRFSTYFTGFNENRQNIYSAEEQQTAISYRIINENMVKHFNNCLNFQAVQQNHKVLEEQLKDYSGVFTPAAFKRFLSQSGIDNYNEKIGHKSDDINAKGVNQFINEYCQKNSTKDDKLKMPKMTILYKQILSDVEDKFKIDVFENDRQMLETINQFYFEIKDNLAGLKNCLEQYLNGSNLGMIYVKKDSLTNISQEIFGEWNFMNRALENHTSQLKINKTQKEKFLKQDTYSIDQIQTAINEYTKDFEDKNISGKNLADYFTAFENEDGKLIEKIESNYKPAEDVLSNDSLESGREAKVEKIKNLLDSIMTVVQFAKPLYLVKSGKAIEVSNKCSDFYDTFDGLYRNISAVIGIYNKTRNYITKKPYSIEKFKINFENSTLLDGWDINKEMANSGILFKKDGRYYLGIMRKDKTDIFNYMPESEDSEKKQQTKILLKQQIITDGKGDYYEKMIYKLLPDPSKMLPKVFFADSNASIFNPPADILEIREKGLYKKEANNPQAMCRWINFLKESIKKHPEWGTYFSFNFSPTADYADASKFYKEVAEQGYNISFDKIRASYIDEKVKSGELYLFEIYNKDFSSYSKGRPNLHTSYWTLLFSPANLTDLVIKLNGKAEIFCRPASLKKNETVVHKAKQPINSKNPLNPNKQSSFDYDIVKDRRFTADKFFFHCPITLNFKAASIAGRFNDDVNKYLRDNSDINIIGIDRGERHLLYYSVIDKDGNIIEQDSFNIVKSSYKNDGKEVEIKTDYHMLLDEKEKQRDAARKSWSAIENIKELKGGYLSHIVHKLALLMIKYNAIVVLEDLNFGFKRGRFKVEKQVYQKFERALIDKLNYLVFKDKKIGEDGHYLKGYQLTAPFESFQKLGKQSGFLFYVLSHYTSKIDPVTGFANLLDTNYKNVEKSREFFAKFDIIAYNSKKDYFEFTFNYTNFPPDKSGSKKVWTVCTAGNERYRYNKEKKVFNCYDVTKELKEFFGKCGINYDNGEELKNVIANQKDKAFFERLHFLLGLTLQLRHIYKDGNEEKDFILSPVTDKDGDFFDSRKAEENQPKDADANGAFNIARKGLMVLEQIKKEGKPGTISNVKWFDFAQKT